MCLCVFISEHRVWALWMATGAYWCHSYQTCPDFSSDGLGSKHSPSICSPPAAIINTPTLPTGAPTRAPKSLTNGPKHGQYQLTAASRKHNNVSVVETWKQQPALKKIRARHSTVKNVLYFIQLIRYEVAHSSHASWKTNQSIYHTFPPKPAVFSWFMGCIGPLLLVQGAYGTLWP